LFEDFYTVYQIVSCIAKYKSSFDSVEFQTQLEDTFVDDMLIVHSEQNIVIKSDCVMRRYENLQYGDEKVIHKSLDALADKTTGVEEYRNAFEMLGVELGRILAQKVGDVLAEETMLVCASEDADWLAKGVENGFGKGVSATLF
jgi:hypothetical protein